MHHTSQTCFVPFAKRLTHTPRIAIRHTPYTIYHTPYPYTGVSAVALTMDHKPDLPAEKARIEAKGGRVFAVEYDDGVDGPARVWLGKKLT
ncbi:hypothetical protein EON63_21720 [archaeon]|nr:MAG: hypothetical protein EON63_21720 [archaeon]